MFLEKFCMSKSVFIILVKYIKLFITEKHLVLFVGLLENHNLFDNV